MDLQLHIDAAGSWLVSTAIRLTRPHCTPMQAMLDAIKAQQASAFTDRGRSSSQGRLHTAGLRRAVGTPWQLPGGQQHILRYAMLCDCGGIRH